MEEEFIAAMALTLHNVKSAVVIIGFRPVESINEPNAGDSVISTRAAPAVSMDNSDVARSGPSCETRADAGENMTSAVDSISMNEVTRSAVRGACTFGVAVLSAVTSGAVD